MLAVFIFGSSVSRAQETTEAVENNPVQAQPEAVNIPAKATSPANCFDYYKFQSVQVSLGTDKDVYLPGEKVTLKGDLINGNDYPVVDGNVFVRVSEKNPNYVSQGQFIIDETILGTDVNLDAKERKAVEYQWTIPQGVKKGDYRVDFFFSAGKKFNLGGLPFTNEIIVGFADFQINSKSNANIFFDKAGTKVDGQKYNHIGNWPSIEAGKSVEIIQPIKNIFNEKKTVQVQYDLYFWDSLNEKDKISSKTEEISVPANGSANLKYVVDSMNDSVYMLKITATSGDYKSIVNIRLTSDQERARLNYPAINKFPIQKGNNFTLFSCFHNTSWRNTSGTVKLALYDKDGDLVDQMEYKGDITGAMMADKKDITAEKDYDYLQLKAQVLDKNGKVVDEYETIYDCGKLNSSACLSAFGKKEGVPERKTAMSMAIAINKTLIALVILAIVLIVILMVVIVRRKKLNN